MNIMKNNMRTCLAIFSMLLCCWMQGISQRCEYTLTLTDTYGDGWAGGFLVVSINGSSSVYSLTGGSADNGSLAHYPILLEAGDTVKMQYIPGLEDLQVGFSFRDSDSTFYVQESFPPRPGVVLDSVLTCPACSAPPSSSVVVVEERSTTARLRWLPREAGGVTEIEYDTVGAPTGNAKKLEKDQPEITLEGLKPKAKYAFYLRTVCNGNTGKRTGPFFFETRWTTDVGIIDIPSPLSDCGIDSRENPIHVVVKNFASDPISLIPLNYAVNGAPSGVTYPSDGAYTGVLGKDSTDLYSFRTQFSLSMPGEYEVVAWSELKEDQDNSNDTIKVKIVNSPFITSLPYFENFETWGGGWKVGANSQEASWERGKPDGTQINTAFSGSNAWTTRYNNNELSYLESPCFDFTRIAQTPQLSFFMQAITEAAGDRAWLEYTTDMGETWIKLGSRTSGGYNWYNQDNDTWSGNISNGDWLYASHPLPGLARTADVRFRFVFKSDDNLRLDGLGIDDVRISVPLTKDAIALKLENNKPLECGSPAELVGFSFGNFGSDTIRQVVVAYQVNGGVINRDTILNMRLANQQQYSHLFRKTFSSEMPGVYTLKAWVQFAGDQFLKNDTITYQFRSVEAIPFAENFESGFIPDDWTLDGDAIVTQQRGNSSVVLSDNLWAMDAFFQATTPAFGPITASDSLRFDFRFMFIGNNAKPTGYTLQSGDSLVVSVSTDCGATFTPVFTRGASNHQATLEMTRIALPLAAYAGKAIKVRFYAQRAPSNPNSDFWFDLDNVNAYRCIGFAAEVLAVKASAASAADGQAIVSVKGGTAPYTIAWSQSNSEEQALRNLRPGNYVVTVSDQLGCSAELPFLIDVVSSVRNPAIGIAGLQLFPNPTSGQITVQWEGAQNSRQLSLEVFTVQGQRVVQQTLPGGTTRYDMSLEALPKGTYYVLVSGSGYRGVGRVVRL